MTWHIWTDGSCMHGYANVPKGLLGWGGWAAIVEHGSEGVVLRGRVPDTTNVRMELRAAIEGVRAVPAGATAVLHTDSMTVVDVHWRWRRNIIGGYRGKDARLWLELDAEFARVPTRIVIVGKGARDPIHRRAHGYAGLEARGGLRNLPVNATPIETSTVARDTKARQQLMDDGHRTRKGMRRRLVHARDCVPGRCVASCPVWLEHGALVYESRRSSEARR